MWVIRLSKDDDDWICKDCNNSPAGKAWIQMIMAQDKIEWERQFRARVAAATCQNKPTPKRKKFFGLF